MFPIIKHINDVLPFIEGNSMIRVKKDEGTGLTVICYMLQDEDMFGGEHEHMERECRGITFYEDGTLAARCLTKFFNVGERAETQPNTIRWQDVERIMLKMDGSMITPVMLPDGSLKCKTKKSFSTKEADLADKILAATPGGTEWVTNMIKAGYTPTFEITSPKMPIVLRYYEDALTLLHVRENTTGGYLLEQVLMDFKPPFPLVENMMHKFYNDGIPANVVSWEKLKHAAETVEGVEGWVIQFKNGDMVKVKTAWYINLHHSVTFTRWRDIARTVCEDKADDLKAAFAMTGRSIEPIIKVEQFIMGKINAARNAVEAHAENGRALQRTPKDMALAFKDHELFGLVMRAFREQEVNYMEWYVKQHLEADWDLEVVEIND